MELELAYGDPRIVALYDLEEAATYDPENPYTTDVEFVRSLADQLAARKVIDVGCGTGTVTVAMVKIGREVVGADPSEAMLSVARAKPNAEGVRWIVSDAASLPPLDADLVTMTGNVAQIFLEDSDWSDALAGIRRSLRPGGVLVFESRNPLDRPWERWDREHTHGVLDTSEGRVDSWLEVIDVSADRVRFVGHNVFERTGEDVVAESTLRFRSPGELSGSLEQADFVIDSVYGDWNRSPLMPDSRLIVHVARRMP